MNEDQVILRARLIASSEAYNTARKRHGASKALRSAWVSAKAACLAAGLPW